MSRRTAVAIVTAVIAMVTGLVTPVAQAAGAYCGIVWGSLAKSGPGVAAPVGPITNIRAGQHDCYDRLVIDVKGSSGPFKVEYVAAVPYQAKDGTIPLRGGAFLQVSLQTLSEGMYVPKNNAEVVNVGGYRTLRQVAWDSFEGYTTVAIGVRARLPFRAFTLVGPGSGSRLVIDVAHLW